MKAAAAVLSERLDGAKPARCFLNEATAPVLLLVLAVLYAGNFPLLKMIELRSPLSLTPSETLTLRFVLASLTLAPWMVFNWHKVAATFKPGCELGFWLSLGFYCQIQGLQRTTAAGTAVALALTGPIVQVLEILIDKKPFSPLVGLCSLGTTLGIALFVTAQGWQNPSPPQSAEVASSELSLHGGLQVVLGEVLALLGGFFFAVHCWRATRIVADGDPSTGLSSDEYSLPVAATSLVTTAVMCLSVCLLSSAFSLERQMLVLGDLSLSTWVEIALTGILCTGVPILTEVAAFRHVDPAIASLIYCTIPLWGACLSLVLLKESFGLASASAGVLILVCSILPSTLNYFGVSRAEVKRGQPLYLLKVDQELTYADA